MNRSFVAALLLATALAPARAEMNADAARAAVTPFYKGLNAEFAGESAGLIRQATAADWVSCRGNDVCNSREEVVAAALGIGLSAGLPLVMKLRMRRALSSAAGR